MQTIMLDGSQYTTSREVHEALRRLLGLPDYYGMNADALYDCLSERKDPPALWILSRGSGEAAETVAKVERVFADLGGKVKELEA